MIIVTGATGFVGRNTVDQLVKDGFEVIATSRNEKGKEYYKKLGIPFVQVDVSKPEDFDKLPQKDVEAVVHTAALLNIDIDKKTPRDYVLVNALGTYNVLEYCRKSGCKKIIYTMTHSDVNCAKEVIITEETPRQFGSRFGPESAIPYIVSKIAGVNFIEAYVRGTGMQGISLRLPGIRGYGSPDTHLNCVYYQFIQKAMKSEPIEIWGEHKIKRDLVYIKDVVAAIIGTIKSKTANGVYNIGSGKGITIEDEAKAIIGAFSPPGNPSKIIYKPDINEVLKQSQIFDISKAKKDFGYNPKYSYADAMKDMKKEIDKQKQTK